jgi:subtilisin family serine protease
MAAPHVTGAVALLLAQGLSPQAAVQRLLDTADPTVSCGAGSPTCKGRLDVARATAG